MCIINAVSGLELGLGLGQRQGVYTINAVSGLELGLGLGQRQGAY